MKRLAIKALALSIALVPAAALAGGESGKGSRGGMHMGRMPAGGVPMGHVKGGMTNVRHHNGGMRWNGGTRAPGGWNAYRRPSVGYVLPRYWIQPSFFLSNFGAYGLSQPAYGYGWSRYYDDAVLTDRYGRVHDSVPNVSWDDGYDDGYGEDYADSYGYSDDRVVYDNRYYEDPYYGGGSASRGYRGKDRDGGLGGALVGGAMGAVAGGLIAKRGDNTAGALLGGGIGAIAGAAIDAGDKAGRGPSRKRLSKRDRYDDRDPRLDYDYGYEGGNGPHWSHSGPAQHPRGPVVSHGGNSRVIYSGGGYGYGYGQPTVTTVIVQPAPVTKTVTTTTEYVTETVYVKSAVKRVARKPAPRKVWKPKPRCVCKVVYR